MTLPLNTILLGDCIEQMKTLPDESIDMVFTSPPYNIRNSTGSGIRSPGKNSLWKTCRLRDGYDQHDDNMPHEEYVEWQRACLTEMYRLIKPNGAVFYNHKWRVQAGLMQDRQDIVSGFPVRQIVIWYRKGSVNYNWRFFYSAYEVIYLICKPDFKLQKRGGYYGDVWEVLPERKNTHPAPFPIELPRRAIHAVNPSVVLDPFMGSGTTAIAALKQGVNYIGIEKSPMYRTMAQERINLFKALDKRENV